MRLGVALTLAAVCASACFDDARDASFALELGVLRERAVAAGQRVDEATVTVVSDRLVGEVARPVDADTLRFELDVPSGLPLLLEAKTCIAVGGNCVANYWGAARATPLPRSRSEVVVPAYPAGELLVDVQRLDGGLVPAGFRVELEAVAPRDPRVASFATRQGERLVVPAGSYRVLTSALSDGGLTLGLLDESVLTVGQGAAVTRTLFFGACVAGLDVDKDGLDCAADCDESSAACGLDCLTDVDADGTPDCRDPCIDDDRDGYGLGGAGCLGPDCDDTSALRAPDRAEICNGADDDCDPGTSDAAACVQQEGGQDADGIIDADGGPGDADFDPADQLGEIDIATECDLAMGDDMSTCGAL